MTCCDEHGIHAEVISGDFSHEEIDAYVERTTRLVKAGELPDDTCRITLEDVGDGEVKIGYYRPNNTPIERIRRITGYLVGTIERWNDAKKAEERDRVKHGLTKTYSAVEDCSTCEKDKPAECVGCPGKA